ncbi:hypothetical protein ALC53_13961 [Atta colombica]|uniref:Uncharacterized protein n=1 Tax=Atta colombica TaxID=520822 RepID=A0A195AUN8_9HYME|nr:hypothetical protein ALC53_13961 [Atta colombica]
MRLCARLGDRRRDDDDNDERGVLPLLLLLLRDYIVANELLPVTWCSSDKGCSVTATGTSGQVRENHRTGEKKRTCNSRWV